VAGGSGGGDSMSDQTTLSDDNGAEAEAVKSKASKLTTDINELSSKIAIYLYPIINQELARRGSLETEAQETLKYLQQEVEEYHRNAQELYDGAKEYGLTVSMIEAEGYLRAWKQIFNMFRANT
jgi:hypothetical protein